MMAYQDHILFFQGKIMTLYEACAINGLRLKHNSDILTDKSIYNYRVESYNIKSCKYIPSIFMYRCRCIWALLSDTLCSY